MSSSGPPPAAPGPGFHEAPSGDEADKIKVSLTGVSETLLITLAARARDAEKPHPLLGDQWAAKLLDRLDYPVRHTVLDSHVDLGVALRARFFDVLATEHLQQQHAADPAGPGLTVLHLACGLDTRCLRLDWRRLGGPRVRWVDVDMADVVALRRRLLPAPPGDYRLLAASVTDDAWLQDVPADRPALVVMEGLSMYLAPAELRALVARLCDRFPRGHIVFDALGSLTIGLQVLIRPVARTGARLQGGIDDGRELESAHRALRLRAQLSPPAFPGYELYPWWTRAAMWVLSLFPYTSSCASMLQYDFGAASATAA